MDPAAQSELVPAPEREASRKDKHAHRAHRHREKRAEEKKEQEMAQLPAVPNQFDGETPGGPGPAEDELLAVLRRRNCEHLFETLRAEKIDAKALAKLSIADLRAAGIVLGDAIKLHDCTRPSATPADSDGVLAPLPGMRDDALYVWCVCWRRIYICRVGKTRCACGHVIDPNDVLAYNHRVWDDEEPVRGACCANGLIPKSAAACAGLSHWTMGSIFVTLSSVTLFTFCGMCGPYVFLYAVYPFWYQFWCPPVCSFCFAWCTWWCCSACGCNCCHDRTGHGGISFLPRRWQEHGQLDNSNTDCCIGVQDAGDCTCCLASNNCERCKLGCYYDCHSCGCKGQSLATFDEPRHEKIYIVTTHLPVPQPAGLGQPGAKSSNNPAAL